MVGLESRAGYGSGRASVLIAEHDEALRGGLEALLGIEGYETHVADDDAAAVEIVHHERIDVVILALELPHRGGLCVVRAIRELRGIELPCVLTAREVSARVQMTAFLEDAFTVVPEPVDDALLKRVVASALLRRRRR